MPLVSKNEICYIIWVCVIAFCEGGHFTLVPNVTKKIYGKDYGTRLYGILFTYTSITSILMIVLQVEFLTSDPATYNVFFYLNGGMSAISFIVLLIFFDEKHYFDKETY